MNRQELIDFGLTFPNIYWNTVTRSGDVLESEWKQRIERSYKLVKRK